MTLTNSRRPYPCVGELCLDGVVKSVDCRSGRRASAKRQKYSDKPCPRFTTTGALRFTCFSISLDLVFDLFVSPYPFFPIFCMDG
jgi:hypothetical protein